MSKFLVIGLGSMGKRRIRCLMSLGVKAKDIFGIDIRNDRCDEAAFKYGIEIADSEEDIDVEQIKAVIVSLPPHLHEIGVDIAVKHKKPVFIEASVLLENTKAILKKVNKAGIFAAPSCTFVYHPMIKQIKKIVRSGELGKICNYSYHSGQYLPDWHKWEDVKDFYVSRRETGGAREIVPYELTWMTDVLGFPKEVKGYFRKTGDVGCEIEDSYVCSMMHEDKVGMLLVDVISRHPLRNLIINFQNGQLQWRWDMERLEVYNADRGEWSFINQNEQKHVEGYGKNIVEDMYEEEMEAFIKGIDEQNNYPNSLEKDIRVLELLDMLEKSDGGF